MTCLETYNLGCQEPCGWVSTGIFATEDTVYTITWEDGLVTKSLPLPIDNRGEIRFRWPFGAHGIWIFKILDQDGNEVTLYEDPTTYDCFQVVGIPTEYSIDPGELATLQAECGA